ncbi:MAG: hypothetical protein QM736_18275 [Vicinamibacterales bacterium]
MRRYAVDDEVRVGLQDSVRDWASAGLLSSEQAATLNATLATDLRRAGSMLRLGLALFTVIAGAAAIGFVFLVANLRSEAVIAVMSALLAVAAFVGATVLVRDVRFYRHGVEEALVVGSIGLFGLAAGLLASATFGASADAVVWFVAMTTVAAASWLAYRMFGYQYAAALGTIAMAIAPLTFSGMSDAARHASAALVFAAMALRASMLRRSAADDIAFDDSEVLRATAVACMYLSLNLYADVGLFGRNVPRWFHWSSYVVTWLLPLASLRVSLRDRDRLLRRVSLAALLITIVTNKTYLGWVRQPWDPMLLGALLAAVAIATRRWLLSGEGGERAGYTPRRLTESEAGVMQMVALASVATPSAPSPAPARPADPSVDAGGRSGGAGGGSAF